MEISSAQLKLDINNLINQIHEDDAKSQKANQELQETSDPYSSNS